MQAKIILALIQIQLNSIRIKIVLKKIIIFFLILRISKEDILRRLIFFGAHVIKISYAMLNVSTMTLPCQTPFPIATD